MIWPSSCGLWGRGGLSQEELLRLDSCCASRRIFSMSPLWMEDDEGTCSNPPTIPSSSSSTTCARGGGTEAVEDVREAERLFISSSTHDPFNPASPLLSAGAATSDIVAHCRAACIRLSAEHEHSSRAHTRVAEPDHGSDVL